MKKRVVSLSVEALSKAKGGAGTAAPKQPSQDVAVLLFWFNRFGTGNRGQIA